MEGVEPVGEAGEALGEAGETAEGAGEAAGDDVGAEEEEQPCNILSNVDRSMDLKNRRGRGIAQFRRLTPLETFSGSMRDRKSHALTSLSYSSLGQLGYSYDNDGRVTSESGSLAAINLPQSEGPNTYSNTNQITSWTDSRPQLRIMLATLRKIR